MLLKFYCDTVWFGFLFVFLAKENNEKILSNVKEIFEPKIFSQSKRYHALLLINQE